MTTPAKIFLSVSVISLAASLTGPGGDIWYGFLKPLGAIFFILFFITNLLSDEVARMDQETQAKQGSAEAQKPSRTPDTRNHGLAASARTA
jgi:hypothetical protein